MLLFLGRSGGGEWRGGKGGGGGGGGEWFINGITRV